MEITDPQPNPKPLLLDHKWCLNISRGKILVTARSKESRMLDLIGCQQN